MFNCRILTAGHTAASPTVALLLKQRGFSLENDPNRNITHLLLPVPSFEADGRIRGGGDLKQLLDALPSNITVIGGNLTHPLLEGFDKKELLEDP